MQERKPDLALIGRLEGNGWIAWWCKWRGHKWRADITEGRATFMKCDRCGECGIQWS